MTQAISHFGNTATATPSPFSAAAWDLPRHSATVGEIIEALDPLLEAVRLQLGGGAERDGLLDQLRGTLSLTARESSLPLAHVPTDDGLRHELTIQAGAISDYIIGKTRQVNESGVSLRRHGADALQSFALRSHCDGHLWRPDVTAQLTGPYGGPNVMQIFNEWLHQIVLLRDSLIPFTNWETLPIPLDRLAGARGLRALEEARGRFVGDLVTKQVQHGTILRMAEAVFGLPSGEASYGFFTGEIVILPCVVGDDIGTAPKALLSWRQDGISGLERAGPTRFPYAQSDYFAQTRSRIGAVSAAPDREAAHARLEARSIGKGEALIDIVVTLGEEFRIDLGQALRGHRFAYRPAVETYAVRFAEPNDEVPVTHPLAELLSLPAIATADSGIHIIHLPDDPLASLAILGKIYPENTIIRGEASWDDVGRSGKKYGARFVLERRDPLASQ
ncbi:MAG: hypothetical protein QM636_08395 [Rhizobium sp.]